MLQYGRGYGQDPTDSPAEVAQETIPLYIYITPSDAQKTFGVAIGRILHTLTYYTGCIGIATSWVGALVFTVQALLESPINVKSPYNNYRI